MALLPGWRRSRSALTDQQLVAAIQRGNQQAWAAFLERYTDLLYARARSYSRSARFLLGAADWEDEAAELYLFMACELQRSLAAFRGDCQPATWVRSVVDRRRAILAAYLRQKDPHRADVRLPRPLQGRLSAAEEEIFRHLVWGFAPEDIPLRLEVSRRQCEAVEARVAARSPQVHARILENRRRLQPHLTLDSDESAEGPEAHSGPGANPDSALEQQRLRRAVQEALRRALERMGTASRRVLILLYNRQASVDQIVALAARDESLGLGEIPNANRVYYLKDKGLKAILEEMYEQFERLEDIPAERRPGQRQLLHHVEEILREQGVPEPRS
jgi:DNA-directed RNA polymerase specialized sigma24 family protein